MHYAPHVYPGQYHYPFYPNTPLYHQGRQPVYRPFYNEVGHESHYRSSESNAHISLRDYGKNPFVVNINEATKQNETFRTALWTGDHFQLTLMSIGVGEDIGLEMHPHVDQFLRIEQGQGIVRMGKEKNNLNFERKVQDEFAIIIPAGTWHNLTNTGNVPLKLYSIYAPPNHPFGTVHVTKTDAIAAEEGHRNTNVSYYTQSGWMNGYNTPNY